MTPLQILKQKMQEVKDVSSNPEYTLIFQMVIELIEETEKELQI